MSNPPGSPEVEEDRPGVVQPGEEPQGAVGGDKIQIGHAAPEQRVSRPKVVMNAQTGHLRGELSARLVQADELGDGVAQGLGAVVRPAKRHLRHRVAQRSSPRPGGVRRDRYPGGFPAMYG
jgi:hypothetical protein